MTIKLQVNKITKQIMKLILVFLLAFSFSLVTPLSRASLLEEDSTKELIVIPKQRVSKFHLDKYLLSKNVYFKKRTEVTDLSFNILNVSESEDIQTKVTEIKKSGLFHLVEPNYKLKPDYIVSSERNKKIIPDDSEFKNQYYLDKIKATSAWLYSRGSFDTVIAILDSGIDYSNSELAKRASQCINTLEYSFSCQDEFGHGTQVASIVGAEVDNKYGTCGISWFNPILPVRVSGEDGNATVSTVITGLDKAIKAQAKIVVISLSTNKLSEALKLTIEEATKKGILVVASGGNTGVQEIRFPAGYDSVVGVGSIDLSNQKSLFSSFGPHIKLVAPGENILVPQLSSSSYFFVNGTSFSVPQVAGIAALVWSVKPELDSKSIRDILFSTASDLGEQGYDYKYGYGLVNAEEALKKALGYK